LIGEPLRIAPSAAWAQMWRRSEAALVLSVFPDHNRIIQSFVVAATFRDGPMLGSCARSAPTSCLRWLALRIG
jgi:hypothetical protein